MGIFKLQRPVYDSDGDYDQVMLYNEDRSVDQIIQMSRDEIEELFGDEYKVYVKGVIKNDGIMRVMNVLDEEQDW